MTAYTLALFNAIMSLCVALDQVFVKPLPVMIFLWAVVTLWSLTFICIGMGLIIESGDK